MRSTKSKELNAKNVPIPQSDHVENRSLELEGFTLSVIAASAVLGDKDQLRQIHSYDEIKRFS